MIGAGARVPALDLARERAVQQAVLLAGEEGLLYSAHDCSDGGLTVALAECCFSTLGRERVGASVKLDGGGLSAEALLFGESDEDIWSYTLAAFVCPACQCLGTNDAPGREVHDWLILHVQRLLGNGEGEFHKGVDISAPYGTPIHATADGVVQMAGMGNGYGREVVINHGGGVETTYAHMSGFHVSAGEQVVRGQVIGYVGTSGRSTGASKTSVRDRGIRPDSSVANGDTIRK